MTYLLCRFALATQQPLDALLALDLRTLITMMQAHADMIEEQAN